MGTPTAHGYFEKPDYGEKGPTIYGLYNAALDITDEYLHSLEGIIAEVANCSDAANITTGTLDGDRLPAMSGTKKGGVPATGTPSGKYLDDSGHWTAPIGEIIYSGTGSGDASGPEGAGNNNLATFDGTTGKLIKDSTSKVADFAVAAKGVTNGDSHDHAGGDGGQIDHGGLAGLADDDHTQYIKHSLATAANDFLVASGAGAFVKKTLAQVQALMVPSAFPVAILQNRQAKNTAGGTATKDDWYPIPLNVEYEDANSIVDADALPAFSLGAGTYRIEVSAEFYSTAASQIRLYKVSATAGVQKNVNNKDMYGTSIRTASTYATVASVLMGTFTVSGTQQFRIEYYVANNQSTSGLGLPCNFAEEVFAQAMITKLT